MSTPNQARKSNRPFMVKLPYAQLSSFNEQALVSIEAALLSGNVTDLPKATVCVRTVDGAERWLSTDGAYAICIALRKATGYEFTYDGRNICLSIGGQVRKRWPTNKPAGKDNWSWLRPLAELLEVPQEDMDRMFPDGKQVVEASDDESTS